MGLVRGDKGVFHMCLFVFGVKEKQQQKNKNNVTSADCSVVWNVEYIPLRNSEAAPLSGPQGKTLQGQDSDHWHF